MHMNKFEQWKNEFEITYKDEAEHAHRFAIFKKNHEFVNSHDAEARGFTVELNKFADMSNAEFVGFFNGLDISVNPKPVTARLPVILETGSKVSDIPKTWDWRTKGAVTGPKNQQQCGSCWSFSATGAVEGAWFLAGHALVSLSEQNLVDCSVPQGNMGCNGGLMDSAFQYIIQNNGIDSEASYPYTATGPNSCKFKKADIAATITNLYDVVQYDEQDLLKAVYHTPTSVAIDASNQSFQFYSSGVYNEPACSETDLDHGVLAVGFGTESGKDYWLVKNSWGHSWGMEGYIRMSRNKNNQCGIATAASYPVV